MFSWIRRRATYANVAMTLALVFAMTGGAYAAKKYLITSTKQISPSVLKQLVGKAGPAGANGKDGAPGAQGPQGPAGANGKDGTNGADGKEGPAGPKGATGQTGPKGLEGSKGATGPTGPAGVINTEGPLPEGKTETGAWAIGTVDVPETKGFAFSVVGTAISFPIRLAEGLEAGQVHAVNDKGEELVGLEELVPSTACLGSVAAPSAAPGNLCVYYGALSHTPVPGVLIANPSKEFGVTSATGALIEMVAGKENEPEPVSGSGAWAVTG